MDLITDLPKSTKGKQNILTVIDRFSKMAHFIALQADTTAPNLAKVFIEHIVRLHGIPKSIVSDRDPRFVSRFWGAVMQSFGTKVKTSTAYHPETDGLTERVHRTIEQLLRCICEKERDWEDKLPLAEMFYNNAV